MNVRSDNRKFSEIECDAIVLGVFEGERPESGVLAEVDKLLSGALSSFFDTGEFNGKTGETAYVFSSGNLKAKRVLFVGLGKQSDFSVDLLRKAVGTATRILRGKKVRKFGVVRRSTLDLPSAARAVVESALLALFEPDKYFTSDKTESKLEEMIVVVPDSDPAILNKAIEQGRIIAEATNFARDIINEPSNLMTPTDLARHAAETARTFGLQIDVLDVEQMKKLGMNALLGVAQGSVEPPKLIVLTYNPSQQTNKTVAIVGKGVTFDTGGISIKPSDGMEKMKYDMAGGATAIAAVRAIAQLKPAVKVMAIVPAVENMPGGRAQRPGDVVKSMSGKTIEVINTDAEGRLILADALAYARQLGATQIVDLATLTGAVSVALGDVYVAIMGNDQAWIDDVINAGKNAGEKIWQLPLDREYREQIKSEIADIQNIGGRKAGTITAAYFLKEFVEDVPWAHLDIAGTAWNETTKPYLAVGPTGVCVRTLVNLVDSVAGK